MLSTDTPAFEKKKMEKLPPGAKLVKKAKIVEKKVFPSPNEKTPTATDPTTIIPKLSTAKHVTVPPSGSYVKDAPTTSVPKDIEAKVASITSVPRDMEIKGRCFGHVVSSSGVSSNID